MVEFNDTCPMCKGKMADGNSFCCIECYNNYQEEIR